MIASIATAVLPVWRSPMISSRWPRPTGIMASMAMMPVWIGPRPSIGTPSGLTTRPSMPLPDGTSTTRPVVRTVSFSLMSEVSPIRTAPTSCSSRLSAMPMTVSPPSPTNSRSSPAMAPFSPSTCAMPSPIAMTVPTSRTSTEVLNDASWDLRTSSILLAVMSATLFLTSRSAHGRPDLGELRRERSVEHPAGDLDDDAAQDRRVDLLAQGDGPAEGGGQFVCELGAQLVVERPGGRDVGHDDAPLALGDLAEDARHVRERVRQATRHHRSGDGDGLGRRRLAEDLAKDVTLL